MAELLVFSYVSFYKSFLPGFDLLLNVRRHPRFIGGVDTDGAFRKAFVKRMYYGYGKRVNFVINISNIKN